MQSPLKPRRSWSDLALFALILCVVATVAMCVLDGVVRGPISYANRGGAPMPTIAMLSAWVTDFRHFFEEGIFSATVFFLGAKFFETRSVLSFGFDRIDAATMTAKGPDEDNIVWIGRRFGTAHEAEAIAAMLAERLSEDAKRDPSR